jgi:polyisoprenoid-binding protein YceI
MRKNLNYAKYAFCALPLLIGTSINVGAEPSTDATDATARISKSDDLGIKAFEAAVFADTQNSSQGTITDLTGNFTIEVTHENVTLLFSFVGYTAQKIPLNGRTSLYTTFNTITFDEPASLEPVDEGRGGFYK